MKRFVQLILITLLPIIFAFVFFILVGFIQPNIVIKYNTQTLFLDDSKPMYYDDKSVSTILIPADLIAKKMGCKVTFDLEAKTMEVRSDKYVVKLTDNSRDVYVNNVLKEAPVPISFKDHHVYAPQRFFCDSLGKSTYWDSASCTINIFDSHSKDISQYKYASDFVSNTNFKTQVNKLYFYNNAYDDNSSLYKISPNYLPKQKINPKINTQIYNAVNVIIDPVYYTDIDYVSSKEVKSNSSPHVFISVDDINNHATQPKNYFKLLFFDEKVFNVKKYTSENDLTQKAIIKLEINNLILNGSSTSIEDKKILSERLKLALIGMFGESTGLNIDEYIDYEYNRLINSEENDTAKYKKIRRFDNIRVDLLYGFESQEKNSLVVYFSYN